MTPPDSAIVPKVMIFITFVNFHDNFLGFFHAKDQLDIVISNSKEKSLNKIAFSCFVKKLSSCCAFKQLRYPFELFFEKFDHAFRELFANL